MSLLVSSAIPTGSYLAVDTLSCRMPPIWPHCHHFSLLWGRAEHYQIYYYRSSP